MNNKKYSCFFSGHRHLPKNEIGIIESFLDEKIMEKYNSGITDFITGGALGFDMLAEESIIRLKDYYGLEGKMKLIIYLPCREYDKYWDVRERERFCNIKVYTDKMLLVTDNLYHSGCMSVRNQKMVDDASCGIVYKKSRRSGTGQTVAMAEKQGLDIINLVDLIN